MEKEGTLNGKTKEIIYNYTKNLANNIKLNYHVTPLRKDSVWQGQKYISLKSAILPLISLSPAIQIPNLLKDNNHELNLGDLNFQLRKSKRKAERIKNLVNNRKFYRKRGSKRAMKLVPFITMHADDDLSSEFELPTENEIEKERKISNSTKSLRSRNVFRKAVVLSNGKYLRMRSHDGDLSRTRYKNRKKNRHVYLQHDDSNFTVRLNYGFFEPHYSGWRQKRFEIKNKSFVIEKDNLGQGNYIKGKKHGLLRYKILL